MITFAHRAHEIGLKIEQHYHTDLEHEKKKNGKEMEKGTTAYRKLYKQERKAHKQEPPLSEMRHKDVTHKDEYTYKQAQ